jgi:hypothetical protein
MIVEDRPEPPASVRQGYRPGSLERLLTAG